MTTPVKSTIDGLFDLIYPPKCVICETLGAYNPCISCLEAVEPVARPYCLRCGHTRYGDVCRNCWARVPSFATARAVGTHTGSLRDAVHQFKYAGRRMLADPLAHLLYRYLVAHADFPWRRADCIVPVPIHSVRQRTRGYNQSELLAVQLSELIRMPALTQAVVRSRHTRPQVELSGVARRENVREAFRVVKPSEIRGKMVLLVDDVATTCSTLHECSLALINADAAKVYALCLAFGA